ncbi:MAG: NUDIX domain-containing protein [Burkholderiaceae bacterium]
MQHRLSAGVLVEHEHRILLVNHEKPGVYDFWVAPGGGVQNDESLHMAAQREAREETGLIVEVGKLVYIEEMLQPGVRHCKFWFTGTLLGGMLSVDAPEARAEHITQARWLAFDELQQFTVYPPVLKERYAADRAAGFPSVTHLELRHMEVW